MTEHILSMLGLALKAGRVEVGEEPVGAAARAKKARVIFVAQDAAPQPETPAATPPARPMEKRPSRPNSAKRRQERPKRRTEPPDWRFAGSLPVKKGKGSRKKTGK